MSSPWGVLPARARPRRKRSGVGGVHRAPGVTLHGVHGPAASVLGPDRTGSPLDAADGWSPRSATDVFLSRSRRVESGEVAPGQRDVAPAGPKGLGIPEQGDALGRPPRRGQTGD